MSERIGHTNYEAWLLDRLEGKLTAEQEAVLDAFLAAHPELDTGLDELPTLQGGPDAHLTKADKETLKRSLPPTGLPADPVDDLLIARLEGDLSPRQLEALRIFLIDHPEHQRAERLYALSKLVPEAMAYAEKKALERHLPPLGLPTRYTLDDHLVARLEGELTAEQEAALAAYLAGNPDAQRQWQLMQGTRIPAEAVVFAAKAGLKKGGRVIPIGAAPAAWVVRLRVAASIAVLLGLAIWALDRQPGTVPQVAEQPQEQVPSPSVDSTHEKGDTEAAYPDAAGEQEHDGSRSAPKTLRDGSTQDEYRVPDPQDRSGKDAPPIAPERSTVDRLAGVVPQLLAEPLAQDAPREVAVPEVNMPLAAGSNEEPMAEERQGIPLGEFVADMFRKRLLDPASEEAGPLGQGDVVAVLDKGLRTVAGDRAGLDVEREADGRVRRFNLRLGRNFAISASR